MNRRKWSIFFLCLVILSCKKSDTDSDPLRDSPIITGYRLTDINGIASGAVGTPNVKVDVSKGSDTYSLRVYPIPALHFVGVGTKFPKPGMEKTIWIKGGHLGNDVPDHYRLGIFNMYAGVEFFRLTTTDDHISIDASSIPAGYYRLYMSSEDLLLYENIVIYKEK